MSRRASTEQIPQPYRHLGIAYLLWLFGGLFGAHKHYLNRPWMGLAYLFTLGFLAIGWLIDAFRLPRQVAEYNAAFDRLFEEYEDEIDELEDRIDTLRQGSVDRRAGSASR